MSKIGLHEFRQRFDPDLSRDLLNICLSKELVINARFIDKDFTTRVLHYDPDAKIPYMVLESFEPREGNKLAGRRKEVLVKFDFIFKGLLYRARFSTILWDVEEKDKVETVFATPPLDIKLASQILKVAPSPMNPMRVRIKLFDEEQLVSVKQLDIKGLLIEDRLLADSLPALSKQKKVTLLFDGHQEIVVEGEYESAGDNELAFVFDKLAPETVRFLSGYIETLYQEELKAKAEREKEGRLKAARPTASSYKILMLTGDDVYFGQLVENLKGRDVRLVQEKGVEPFVELLSRSNWDLLLIDGAFSGLDLWGLSRQMKEILDNRSGNKPQLMLISECMDEDAIVYAQYCGFEHLFCRNAFLGQAVSHVGAVSGHHEWITLSPEEKAVVVIDDDKNLTFTLQHALTAQGFRPLVASSGKEGVRAAKQYRPVCVIIELAIRSGDAIDALRVLTRMPFTKNIPVIVLTVSKDATDVQQVKQLGIEHYYNKPMDTAKIVEIVKTLDPVSAEK